MRWVVGDLHGCATELENLLAAIRFDPSRDELWSTGDLINRGPASLETLRLWRDVGGRAVIGNHDLYALTVRAGLRSRRNDTLDDIRAAPDGDDLLDRLQRQPVLVALDTEGDGPDAWLVHAGIDPRWSDLAALARRLNALPHDRRWLENDDVAYAATVRCVDAEGAPRKGHASTCGTGSQPWFDHPGLDSVTGGRLVVHGHWAILGHYRGPRSLGLDSGCVYGGPLTAWCQDEDRIVQVTRGHRLRHR